MIRCANAKLDLSRAAVAYDFSRAAVMLDLSTAVRVVPGPGEDPRLVQYAGARLAFAGVQKVYAGVVEEPETPD